jgi:DNA recombination protein RmuC
MQQNSAEANRLVQTVGEHLGRVIEFSQQMAGLGSEISRLQDLFKSPKIRGGLGEQMLEEALRQVLPPAGFQMQKRFPGGEVVDAAIRVGDRWVVIDSKFPLENFRRATELENETERKNARSQFLRDVRKHVDAIAAKYIRPAEGTLDFALMYVPAEAVYAEIVAEYGDGSVVSAALAKKVIPVSPLHFYTYLSTVSIGMKGMEIEKRANEIVAEINDLKRGVSKIEDPFGKLGGHLDNAKKQYEETSRQISRFVEKLRDIAEKPEIPAQAALPLRIVPPE